MSRLTESAIEAFVVKLFERLGYDSIYTPDIAPDGGRPERSRYDDVILNERLSAAVRRINSTVLKQAEMIANKLAVN